MKASRGSSGQLRAIGFWRGLGLALVLTHAAASLCGAATTIFAWGADTAGQLQVPSGLTNAVAVSAGDSHSLALKKDGSVAGWGQTTSPPALTNAIAIAAGSGYSFAVKADGTVAFWKDDPNALAWLAPPAWLANVTALATGWDPLNPWHHALALRTDGTIVAWGDNTWGQTNVPSGLSNVVAVAAGDGNSLALLANGTLVAWGDDSFSKSEIPADLTNVTAIAAGQLHSLAIKADSTVAAWGYDRYGQVSSAPTQTGFISISGGGAHSLALRTTGTPAIIQQPVSQTVPLGDNGFFSVNAVGAPIISYQWRHNLTNLVAATNFSLTVTNVKMTDAGSYAVVVSNPYGSVTSAVAVLTPVTSPPVVTVPPQDLSTNCGDVAVFQVGVNGSRPLSYQWLFNGTAIDGGTNSSLTVSNVTTSLTGKYSVVVTNVYGSATSATATLTMTIDHSILVTPLQAFGTQGASFRYTVPVRHSPISFRAQYLPSGLSIDAATGVISGTPLESGTFGVYITAANACTSDTQTLVLSIYSSAPYIYSLLDISATQNASLSYRIYAYPTATSFGATDLPTSLTVDPVTGRITGMPLYPGDFYPTIWASNYWGVGSAVLHIHVANAALSALSISDVSMAYSSPYLVGFQFLLRDNPDPSIGNPVVINPSLLQVTCKEDDASISPSESDHFLTLSSRKSKTFLVLDFSESIADVYLNGDSNGDGISDAVDDVVLGAQIFVNAQPDQAQIGVYEFHSEDVNPTNVVKLTTDKNLLNQQIAGIWTNYVKNYPGGSRCWDALYYAITNLGKFNSDEYHNVVFISDGQDESSFNTVSNVVWAATNANVRVYCVGFGAELDAQTLRSITDQTSGRYYTANNPADLTVKFAQIGSELAGSYFLRWPTLKRFKPSTFMPSFSITYNSLTANSPTNPWHTEVVTNDPGPPPDISTNSITNFIIAYFDPSKYAGNASVGLLRFITNSDTLPLSLTLHADYIPRFVQQLHIHYRPNWPCTTTLESSASGELLYGWSLSETNDASGDRWLTLGSPGAASYLPFGGLGDLVTFNLRDMQFFTNAFSVFTNDNSVYTGGQSFLLASTNVTPFITVYTNLPYGTPVPWLRSYGFSGDLAAAELSDPDHDGIPTWQEYQANTNPTNTASVFAVSPLARASDGRFLITFSTSTNRTYRVESSTNLVDWVTVQDSVPGISAAVTVTDTSYTPSSSLFYRVLAY